MELETRKPSHFLAVESVVRRLPETPSSSTEVVKRKEDNATSSARRYPARGVKTRPPRGPHPSHTRPGPNSSAFHDTESTSTIWPERPKQQSPVAPPWVSNAPALGAQCIALGVAPSRQHGAFAHLSLVLICAEFTRSATHEITKEAPSLNGDRHAARSYAN
jgi:hypothetical protein